MLPQEYVETARRFLESADRRATSGSWRAAASSPECCG